MCVRGQAPLARTQAIEEQCKCGKEHYGERPVRGWHLQHEAIEWDLGAALEELAGIVHLCHDAARATEGGHGEHASRLPEAYCQEIASVVYEIG